MRLVEELFDISLEFNDVLHSTFIDMLGNREDVEQVEVDGGDLIIYWKPDHLLCADRAAKHSEDETEPARTEQTKVSANRCGDAI